MRRAFEDRLAKLEAHAAGGPTYIVLLLGDDCDAFDAAYASGDYDAAVGVLAVSNPYVPAWALREYYLHAAYDDGALA